MSVEKANNPAARQIVYNESIKSSRGVPKIKQKKTNNDSFENL